MIKTNEELCEVLGSVEKFNDYMSNYTEGILQKVMLAVPALVIHHIKNEHLYNKLRDDFFTSNPELEEYKPLLAQQLNIVAAEHPDWGIKEIFTESGIITKQLIRESLEVKNAKIV